MKRPFLSHRFHGQDIFDLFASANRIREHFRGNTVDLCAIINAKSGACPEDCSYCAQSAKSTAEIKTFLLVEKETVLEKAKEAKKGGAKRFCIVTSGKKASATDLAKIAEMVSAVREARPAALRYFGTVVKGRPPATEGRRTGALP